MRQVFISYSSKDYPQALAVRNVLEQNGITCWMAPESIPGGSNYTKEIPIAIKGCQAFVLMLSNNAQNSHWVLKELDSAVNAGKIILPFQLEDVPLSDEFNFLLTGAQRYAAYQRKSEAMQNLVQRVKAIIEADAQAHGQPEAAEAAPAAPAAPAADPLQGKSMNDLFGHLFGQNQAAGNPAASAHTGVHRSAHTGTHSGVQSIQKCPACGSVDVEEFPDQVKPRDAGEHLLVKGLSIGMAFVAPTAVMFLFFIIVAIMEMFLFFLDPDIFEAMGIVALVAMIPAIFFGYKLGKKLACTRISRQRIRKHIKVTECRCNTCQKKFQTAENQ